MCGTALVAPSTLATELADFAEAFAAASDLDDPLTLLLASSVGLQLAVRAGQFELAKERLAILRTMAEKLGQPLYLWVAGYTDASLALLHGDTEEAEAARHRGARGGHGRRTARRFCLYGVQLMQTRYEQGRMGELVSLIADAADQNPSIPAFRGSLGGGTPRCWRTKRRPGNWWTRLRHDSFSLPEDSAWFDGIVYYARVVIELQLRAHAERLIELLVPFRDQVPHNGLIPQPPVATYLGGLATVVGRYEEAESYFEQASRAQYPWRDAVRRGRNEHVVGSNAPCSQRARRRRPLRSLLEQARESAAARGYAMVERRAKAELSKLC